MDIRHTLFLFALLVPLAIDTFVLSTALGLAGLPKKDQTRTSLILAGFEAFMPVVGVLIGAGVGDFLGHFAGYGAAAVIAFAGVLMLRPAKKEDKEEQRIRLMAHARGLAIINLGIGISIDELAIGLSLGLLHIPLVVAVIFLGLLAFAASQLGLKLGSKLNERMRDGAEKLAGIALISVALILIAIKASGHQF